MIAPIAVGAAALMAGVAQAQVTATGTMGSTNPPQATLGTAVNSTSMARLVSLNAIDDFCLFAPPEPNSVIGNTEAEEVAWCVQARNDARQIPDGTFTSVHFVKTPLYWQIQGLGDLTKLNIASGDEGGELDPHGATGLGNPVGGNVTTNATGSDVHYEEWMNYMSYQQFCLRICIAENSTYSAAEMCQHTLDEMGCNWVMPGDYTDNSFTECDGDSAYPPGIYPQANGSTSTFQQRYTGTFTDGSGSVGMWTQGQTVTPQTAYSVPATSNCKTYSTIGNGVAAVATGSSNSSSASATGSASGSGAAASGSAKASGSGASGSAAASGSRTTANTAASASASGASSGALPAVAGNNIVAGVFSLVAVFAGAGAFLL
ncbi:uncharacterized protein I303_107746 [Kwoniella dejecticola CBS 10117]|uniref:Immunoreactive mannoprotein MP88 n=1 Tax=Kwoniella dejecticola CBS 10117 TaxID=1296121 RepID=A0A1A5ZVK0_9TREE|nr:immunoreactive mannoprotein MP88 [Kwoniella dejecticola CBS 10117]OBR81841.1 immunoreactive mannoprotein MP88 [Kwoniella dejecticola CBS 10117]